MGVIYSILYLNSNLNIQKTVINKQLTQYTFKNNKMKYLMQ